MYYTIPTLLKRLNESRSNKGLSPIVDFRLNNGSLHSSSSIDTRSSSRAATRSRAVVSRAVNQGFSY